MSAEPARQAAMYISSAVQCALVYNKLYHIPAGKLKPRQIMKQDLLYK